MSHGGTRGPPARLPITCSQQTIGGETRLRSRNKLGGDDGIVGAAASTLLSFCLRNHHIQFGTVGVPSSCAVVGCSVRRASSATRVPPHQSQIERAAERNAIPELSFLL